MNNLEPRYVLGIDPSGNFYEGSGTTGWCFFDRVENKFIACGSKQAKQYESQVLYWYAHIELIDQIIALYGHNFSVSMEDFILYAAQSKSQINSSMETSQLIGIIKVHCHMQNIPLYIRPAVRVKKRWSDYILVHKGYIKQSGSRYFVPCKDNALCDHERDAMRHALHCANFELKGDNHERS